MRAASQDERLADAVTTQVAADMRGALDADRGSMPYVDLRADVGPLDGQVDPFDVAAGIAQPPANGTRRRVRDIDEPEAEATAPTPVRQRT